MQTKRKNNWSIWPTRAAIWRRNVFIWDLDHRDPHYHFVNTEHPCNFWVKRLNQFYRIILNGTTDIDLPCEVGVVEYAKKWWINVKYIPIIHAQRNASKYFHSVSAYRSMNIWPADGTHAHINMYGFYLARLILNTLSTFACYFCESDPPHFINNIFSECSTQTKLDSIFFVLDYSFLWASQNTHLKNREGSFLRNRILFVDDRNGKR